jgi:DNA ligase (NAD+)
MDIEGLGDAVVESLVGQRLIRTAADLYRLTERDLLTLPLFAQKRAENLLAKIRESRGRGLARLLYALGIRHVGEKAAVDLAEHFRSMDRLSRADQASLEAVPGIGPAVSGAVVEFFRQPETRALIAALKGVRVNMALPKREAGPQPLAGSVIVFTGELSAMSRADAELLVRRLGGRASSSVSQQTTLVVAGASPGSKLAQARTLGVKVIDEAAFKKLVGS